MKEEKYTFDMKQVYIIEPLKIKRCLHCKVELTTEMETKYTYKKVCSEWCSDFIYPPQVTKNVKLCKHLVNGEKCGNVCLASKDKNNKKFYKDYCEEHNHLHIIKGRLTSN